MRPGPTLAHSWRSAFRAGIKLPTRSTRASAIGLLGSGLHSIFERPYLGRGITISAAMAATGSAPSGAGLPAEARTRDKDAANASRDAWWENYVRSTALKTDHLGQHFSARSTTFYRRAGMRR